MTTSERKKLTFEQAEGVEQLPGQLQLKELSPQLRSLLWKAVYEGLDECKEYTSINIHLTDPWETILYDKHVYKDHLMADDFNSKFKEHSSNLKSIFTGGDYIEIFGFLQFVIRHPRCHHRFPEKINSILAYAGAAYRIFENDTIIPISSEAEVLNLKRAFSDLQSQEFNGARKHLSNAGTALTAGNYSDSVRESIHAVESVARVLVAKGNFNDALNELEKMSGIHPALKKGFSNIYGYTSDEKGLRHPLLDNKEARVDETDALFMIGACASFVSYMINKARLGKKKT